MQELNLTDWKEVDVLLTKLRPREFDVRAAAITNLNAVNEMRIEGNLGRRRPPYVTTDLVVIDGRHLIDAWEREEPQPTMIRVRMFPFSWEALTKEQKAEVKAWALRQNAPPKGEGYREFYKTEDVVHVIKSLYNDGFDKEYIRKVLCDVPLNKFNTAHKIAATSFDQHIIYQVRKRMVEENLTPEEAKTLLPLRLHPILMSAIAPGTNKRYEDKWGVRHIKNRQTIIKKAEAAIDRYAKQLKNKVGNPGYSPQNVRAVVAYHKETIVAMAVRAERAFSVVEKEILAYEAREATLAPKSKVIKMRKVAARKK